MVSAIPSGCHPNLIPLALYCPSIGSHPFISPLKALRAQQGWNKGRAEGRRPGYGPRDDVRVTDRSGRYPAADVITCREVDVGETASSLLAAFKQAGKGVREEGGVKWYQDGMKEREVWTVVGEGGN